MPFIISMEINDAAAQDKKNWNQFVSRHYPPIGAFMQTWEWGNFQENLGRKIGRYFLTDKNELAAAFTLVQHKLPFGLSYAYIPRGPIISSHIQKEEGRLLEILKSTRKWALESRPDFVFMRLEPPLSFLTSKLNRHDFSIPSYYVQPRYNHAIFLDRTEEEILKSFHPSTRSNIRRAEKRGVTINLKSSLTEVDHQQFMSMAKETIRRNSGKNAYPNLSYFRAMAQAIPLVTETHNPENLSLGVFYGYQHGQPAAIHFVLFFGETATYLYGASYSDHLNSKVTTYLHWSAMREARRRNCLYYDLGGIDDKRWPTLTNFKRQFRGKEFNYLGNIDIPLRPFLYKVYNWSKGFKIS